MSNFDLASLALRAAFPTNVILTDDQGLPSVMVYVPKFKLSDVIDGASDTVHPAFIIGGVEKSGIYISKFQNTVYENRAYSIPGEDPKVSIGANNARNYCESKGPGWHLMSSVEWGAVALWCKKNGWMPWGNNGDGKDIRETMHRAIPTLIASDGKIYRVATGTGPVEWSHNRQSDGIYDLAGNIWEWVDGMRLVYGELQLLENNAAADSDNSKLASSNAWKAIDGTTGALITPDGNGTTANSLKLDMAAGKWQWITGAQADRKDEYRYCTFAGVTTAETVCEAVKELLYALALLPDDSTFDYQEDGFYANNGAAERFPLRGGHWGYGTHAGVFCAGLHYSRAHTGTGIGFRCAYYE